MAKALNKGDRVQIFLDTPGDQPVRGQVVVARKKALDGHQYGIKLDEHHPRGSDLEGELEKIDSGGFGWWTLPENCEVLKQ